MKRIIFSVVFILFGAALFAQSYDYNVGGYSYDTGEYVYGDIEADRYGNVRGYIYLEDGREVYVDGEFDGYGEMEVYGDDGNFYELEVD